MEHITTTITVVAWAAVIVFALGTMRYGIQMWTNRQTDVTMPDVTYNRFNICVRPDLLTEAGLAARRKYFTCMSGLMLAIAALVIGDCCK